jgi:CspA family cold shock protein
MAKQIENGTVKFFHDAKGYGYIVGDGGQEIFFHHSGVIKSAGHPLVKGDRVSFVETNGERGMKAVEVTKVK